MIETARSSRSRCKRCGVGIDQGELRFGGYIVEGHMFVDWYHLACAQQALPERLAPALAAVGMTLADLPPPPDEGLAKLAGVERSPSSRARCHACNTAIAQGALRVIVRLERNPEAPEFAAAPKGYLHLACAPAYSNHADGLDAYLAKRATKLPKDDRAAVANLLLAARLVATDPRGRDLGAQGALDVLGDWLEQAHGIVLPEPDLAQLPGVAPAPPASKPAPKPRAKSKPTAKRAPRLRVLTLLDGTKPTLPRPKPAKPKPKPKANPKTSSKPKSPRSRSRPKRR